MERFEGRGHGKFILMGEHAVVYGKPAVGTHLERGVRVSLLRSGRTHALPPEQRMKPLDETGRRAYALAARRIGLDPGAFRIKVSSRLPAGQGLGSSAALSVAMARALLRAGRSRETDAKIVRTAQVLEGVFHGSPSGIDATLALGNGPLLYRKGARAVRIRVGAPLPVIVLMSGTSPSTRIMVEKVRKKDRRTVARVMEEIERLVLEALVHIRKGSLEALGRAMNENHELLAKLGVSTKRLEDLRRAALEAGALGAKLTGGGGGGAVICLAGSRARARKIVKALNMGKNSFINMVT
jgi:mevalonate kinase